MKEVWKGREEGNDIPIATLSPPEDSYIDMGSNESHFNVSLIVRDKVIGLSTNHDLFEEKGEPKRYQTEVLLLTRLTLYRKAKPAHGTEKRSLGLNSQMAVNHSFYIRVKLSIRGN